MIKLNELLKPFHDDLINRLTEMKEALKAMSLFKRKEKVSVGSPYSIEKYEPVLRSSICTGELTACMRDRETGKLHEVMTIRTPEDMKEFAAEYNINPDMVRTVY